MSYTDTQLFATYYTSMQENLAPEEIMEISEWIKKSNDDQIKSLLINGSYDYNVDSVSLFDEMFSGLLSELNPNDAGIKGITGAGGKYITGIIDMDKLNAYIDNLRSNVLKTSYDAGYHSGHSTGETLGGAKGLAAAAIVALVLMVAHKAYKRFLDKAARACSGKSGTEKTNCINKFKTQAKLKKIKDLQTGMKSCGNTKKPEKCKAKIQIKVNKIKSTMGTA